MYFIELYKFKRLSSLKHVDTVYYWSVNLGLLDKCTICTSPNKFIKHNIMSKQ